MPSLHLVTDPAPAPLADRRDMTDAPAIVERMARDILAARRDGEHGPVDLTERGWTVAQAMRWGAQARDLAATPAFATQDVVTRMREVEEAGAAAVSDALGVAAPITGDMTTRIDDLGSGDAA